MRTLEVSEETYEKIKEQLTEEDKEVNQLSDIVGGKYFFRTVTYHLVGRVVKQFGNFFELENASWVADSGRFMDAIVSGSLNEVEPTGKAYINISTVTDFYPWRHELPKEQK